MNVEQIAEKIGVGPTKLKALLFALVVAGYLIVKDEFFSNTDAANRFLVKGSPSCVVDMHELLSTMWNAALKTAESIRKILSNLGMHQIEFYKTCQAKHLYFWHFRFFSYAPHKWLNDEISS